MSAAAVFTQYGLAMSSDGPNDRFLRHVDFMHLPVGVYVVAPDGYFLGCNEGARSILGLPAEGPVEARISDFHADPGRYAELAAAADDAEKRGRGFEKSIERLRVGGRDVYVEDYLKPLRDESGELTGYVGCMVDVTDEHRSTERSDALAHQVEELTLDIGRILHANTSTLLMVNQTLTATAAALRPEGVAADVEPEEVSPEQFQAQVARTARQLAQALERLLAAGDAERRLEALPAEAWQALEEQIDQLRDYEERIRVEEMRNPTLRKSAVAVADACRAVKPGWLPRQVIRDALRLAMELQRLICFLDVQNTRTTVVQMDFSLRALRDFITSEVRARESARRLSVDVLVQEAVSQLAEFAKGSNVEIIWRERGDRAYVHGTERDLIRAFANLLHNAIKYSWRRDRSKSPWVAIRTSESEEGTVSIEFETWGVPITEDEIDDGLIFQMGYRGKWSTDRGRLGTGIGLTDAQRVATAHGGSLEVESKPAQPTVSKPEAEDYYRRPFLTRVTLRLPAAD